MPRILAIVEGHGEVEGVPLLVRRIAEALHAGTDLDVRPPLRTKRSRLLRGHELERAVELAARQTGPQDGILILLDADADCPRELAASVMARARAARADRRIRVVLAKVEFESWFIAAAESIGGHRQIAADIVAPDDPESIRDAKGWLSERMVAGRTYRPTLDQPALCAVFDIRAARARSRSFDKLWRDVESLLRPD